MGVVKIIKDWTLPLAMGVGTVVYLVFAFTPSLHEASLFFAPVMQAILPLFMFLVLFVTFCKVDFRKLRPVAWHAWVGLLQVLFVLLLTALILWIEAGGSGFLLPVVSDHDALVLLEAMLMCVISPCATAAAVVTQKLGGSLEQTTAYTFFSNFLTALLAPVCFPLIEPAAHVVFLTAFLRILREVVLVLLVPMLLAYIVKHHLHRLHARIVAVRDLSYYLWGCSLMIVTGTTVRNIVHADASPGLLVAIALLGLLVCMLQFAVGRRVGRRYHRVQESGQALGQKNTAFAIWLSTTYINPLSSVGPGCYILWQNIVNSVEIWQKQKNTAATS
jgi:BASS family bile acid:Na+ symporter